MNPHSKAKLTAVSRAEMIRRIVDLHHPVAQVAAGFGISERCAYTWLARFRSEGPAGLHNRSSRPHRSPRTTHPLRVARVLALRRRKLPAFQIARLAKVSKAAVSRLLHRHALRLSTLEPPLPIRRYERAHPGELIHFDIKKLARIERTGHRITGDRQRDHVPGAGWEFLHIAIDDHSRLAFAQLLPDESARSAIAFLHATLAFFHKHGIHTQRIYSDNGSCYRAFAMRDAVQALGLKHRFTRPYTPKTNGKAERFIQTALREWAYARAYQTSDQRSAELPHWLHRYNWHRPHGSLKAKTPISRLGLAEDNLLRFHS
jgi:transposase InsO family protein